MFINRINKIKKGVDLSKKDEAMLQMIYYQDLAWHIYEYQLNRWQLKTNFRTTQETLFIQYIQRHEEQIKWLLIGLETELIEQIYEVAPQMKIILWPDSLFSLVTFNHQLWGAKGEEEVASTLEMKVQQEQDEVDYFLMRFYHTSSRYQAYKVYEKWQYERNLSSGIGNKIADIFQIYEEEIFNYFRYRSILQKWKKAMIIKIKQ